MAGGAPRVGEKLPIIVQKCGAVVGSHAAEWKTRSGHFIRVHVPINITDWRKVPKNFKDEVWNALKDEFEINVGEKIARPVLERAFSQRFRTMKTTFRNQFLYNAENVGAAISNCPKGVDPNHWADFVTHEMKPKVIARNKKNQMNRKKNKVGHTLGRSTYAQTDYELEQAHPGKKAKRSETWKKGHEKHDGTPLESAKELYKLVEDAEKKRLESGIVEEDLDCDEIAEVFGLDRGSRVRGVGSHASKKQIQHVAIASATFEQKNSKLETDVADLKTMMTAILKHAKNGSIFHQTPTATVNTPEPATGSGSINRLVSPTPSPTPFSTPSPTPESSSMSNYKVMLLDGEGTAVAKGFVETNSTRGICHGRKILLGEKKVYIEEVLNGDAPLYGGTQNGNSVLQDYMEGGYLVWLEPRLQKL